MHVDNRYLGLDEKALGEVATSTQIPIFDENSTIDIGSIYSFQTHLERCEVRDQLRECGRKYVPLLGIHHKKYKDRAFVHCKKGNILALHIERNIMVHYDCFQENMPSYPSARIQQPRPQYSVFGRYDVLKSIHIIHHSSNQKSS